MKSIKDLLQTGLAKPRVAAFRRRYAKQIAFLQARLSPEEYLGLHLTLGALVLIGSAWLFGGIAEEVLHNEPLTVFDLRVSEWLHAHRVVRLTSAMLIVTDLGSTVFVTIATVLVSLFLLWRRRRYELLTLLLAVPGGALLNVLLKSAFHRHRPSFNDPVVSFTGYSFPSGHTMAATVLYGALAVLVIRNVRGWRWRVLTILSAGLVILSVGSSRVYLGAHYLSDVLAAMIEGLAWLAITVTAVETLRRHKRRLAKR